jgi:cell wall assembly regulator SMI1
VGRFNDRDWGDSSDRGHCAATSGSLNPSALPSTYAWHDRPRDGQPPRGITVELDHDLRIPGARDSVTLPAGYVGAQVDYGYARTVDTAQGSTVDHSLFAASASASAERAYVALSRGRMSNCIYATRDLAWIDAIGQRRGHALAVDQSPGTDRTLRQVMRLGSPGRDHDRQPPLEIGL